VVYSSTKYHIDSVNKTFESNSKYVRSGRFNKISGSKDYMDIEYENGPSKHFTYVFNTFVMLTVFNFINARKIFDEFNILERITQSHTFLMICVIIFFF